MEGNSPSYWTPDLLSAQQSTWKKEMCLLMLGNKKLRGEGAMPRMGISKREFVLVFSWNFVRLHQGVFFGRKGWKMPPMRDLEKSPWVIGLPRSYSVSNGFGTAHSAFEVSVEKWTGRGLRGYQTDTFLLFEFPIHNLCTVLAPNTQERGRCGRGTRLDLLRRGSGRPASLATDTKWRCP